MQTNGPREHSMAFGITWHQNGNNEHKPQAFFRVQTPDSGLLIWNYCSLTNHFWLTIVLSTSWMYQLFSILTSYPTNTSFHPHSSIWNHHHSKWKKYIHTWSTNYETSPPTKCSQNWAHVAQSVVVCSNPPSPCALFNIHFPTLKPHLSLP